MINDVYNYMAKAQAETTAAAHASDNIIDLKAAGDALVRPVRFHTLITTTCTSGGSATVVFGLQTSVDAAFTSPIDLWTSAAIAVATLAAGYHPTGQLGVTLNSGCKQYVRGIATIAVAALTAGAWDMWLTPDADTNNFTA